MKNVTITLPENAVARARVAAAAQGMSLSKFVSELVLRELGQSQTAQLEALEQFLSGPGYPGISKNWRGREDLYAEREDELLRGHKPSRLRHRSGRTEKAAGHRGLAEKDDQEPYTGSQSAKPK
jgi:hypothetical protein